MSLGPLDSLLKCFPVHPTHSPRPTHTTRPSRTCTSGWARRAVKFRSGARSSAQPGLGHHLYSAGNPPSPKQRPESSGGGAARNVRSNLGWHQGSLTHFPTGLPSWLRQRAQECPDPPPSFQLNQKLDIQGKGQEREQPGTGPSLPQFPSRLTSRAEATHVCLLSRNIPTACLKRKYSVTDLEQ